MSTFTRQEEDSLNRTVLEIDINNHPGAMSHVVGLFSRRAFNIEGIHCVPVGDSQKSRIWLLLKADERVPQLIKQLDKLEDVIMIRQHDAGHPVFGEPLLE